jgi:hypothetical protein
MIDIRPGQVVFVKSFGVRSERVRFNYKTKRSCEEICILLGTWKEKDPLPTPNQLTSLLGEIGYFPGDLITQVFGEKGFKKMEEAYRKKYFDETST